MLGVIPGFWIVVLDHIRVRNCWWWRAVIRIYSRNWSCNSRWHWRCWVSKVSENLHSKKRLDYQLAIFMLIHAAVQTEIVLKTLNPELAVESINPSIWGCQCTSLMSCWPWCTNSSCGGTSGSSLFPSFSTAKSHWKKKYCSIISESCFCSVWWRGPLTEKRTIRAFGFTSCHI